MIKIDHHRLYANNIPSLQPSLIALKKQEIALHSAWYGLLNGMDCENVLRGQPAGSYVLRQGESDTHYYLSWVIDPEKNRFQHQPFCIFTDSSGNTGWLHRNCVITRNEQLEEIIPKMMDRSKEMCIPLPKD